MNMIVIIIVVISYGIFFKRSDSYFFGIFIVFFFRIDGYFYSVVGIGDCCGNFI